MRLGRGSFGGGAVVRLGQGNVMQWRGFLTTRPFLYVDTRLYTMPYQSVHSLVALSVCLSISRSITFLNCERFSHYCSCPTVPGWIAVYPVFFQCTFLRVHIHTHITMKFCRNLFSVLRDSTPGYVGPSIRRLVGRLVGLSPFHFFGVFESL